MAHSGRTTEDGFVFPPDVGMLDLTLVVQQVIVTGHLTEGLHHPVEARANNAQHLQPVTAVSIVQENLFPSIPARGDMINGPREFQP